MAAILASIAVFIAAYVPARRAAKLEPIETLRGTGQ
jgi:ABC-type lipoprotein release transport system permease subunit